MYLSPFITVYAIEVIQFLHLYWLHHTDKHVITHNAQGADVRYEMLQWHQNSRWLIFVPLWIPSFYV